MVTTGARLARVRSICTFHIVGMQKSSQTAWTRSKYKQLIVLDEADMGIGLIGDRELGDLHRFVFLLCPMIRGHW